MLSAYTCIERIIFYSFYQHQILCVSLYLSLVIISNSLDLTHKLRNNKLGKAYVCVNEKRPIRDNFLFNKLFSI